MSQFFPHAAYAEDQAMATTILTTHVLHRGMQTGATVGIVTGTSTYLYRLSRSEFQLRTALRSSHFASVLKGAVYPTLTQTIFKHAGVGALVSMAAISVSLLARMQGREQIEWQDRAWRLTENKGQLEVDRWSLGGALAGAVSSLSRQQKLTLRQLVGRTGVGSMMGVLGYLSYRYGYMRGKRSDDSVSMSETSTGTAI